MTSTSSNLEPDLITYSTLLKGYCHIGDLDKALQIADTIKSKGLRCDELVYNTLMDGCVRANDLSAGIGLFAEMTHSGMGPSTITHSILVRLYQRSGYTEQALEAVAQLYEHHGIPRPNALLTSASTSEQTHGSYNIGAKSSKGGRLNGRRAGRGRTQRAAPVPPLYAPPGVAGVAANMGLSPAPYLPGVGVPPQGFLQNLQQPPLLPGLLPAVPGGVVPPPPPPHLALGGAELGTAPPPGMAAAPAPMPPGHLLGHPCNLSQQPPGVLLGPDSLLFPYKHVESDAAWNTLANSYACGHLPYMPHEAAKPPVSSDVQQGLAYTGSQIWGGA